MCNVPNPENNYGEVQYIFKCSFEFSISTYNFLMHWTPMGFNVVHCGWSDLLEQIAGYPILSNISRHKNVTPISNMWTARNCRNLLTWICKVNIEQRLNISTYVSCWSNTAGTVNEVLWSNHPMPRINPLCQGSFALCQGSVFFFVVACRYWGIVCWDRVGYIL